MDILRENPDLSLVAEANGKVVGYAQAEIHDDKAVLEDIEVAEKYQGKGRGKRLLTEQIKALGRKGTEMIVAEVHYKCASAIPFYYSHNFRMTEIVRDYSGVGHDGIALTLILS